MKTALASLVLLSASTCFASSVCVFTIPNTVGYAATVYCDGHKKPLSSYEVQLDGTVDVENQSKTLQHLVSKGYVIASEIYNDGDQYTLVRR